MFQHLTVARVAEGLGVSWNIANEAALAEGRRVLIKNPHRFGYAKLDRQATATDRYSAPAARQLRCASAPAWSLV